MTIKEAKRVINRAGYKILNENESEVDKAINYALSGVEGNERYKYLDPLFKKIEDLAKELTNPLGWLDESLEDSRIYLNQILNSLLKIYNIRDADRDAHDPDYVPKTW